MILIHQDFKHFACLTYLKMTNKSLVRKVIKYEINLFKRI